MHKSKRNKNPNHYYHHHHQKYFFKFKNKAYLVQVLHKFQSQLANSHTMEELNSLNIWKRYFLLLKYQKNLQKTKVIESYHMIEKAVVLFSSYLLEQNNIKTNFLKTGNEMYPAGKNHLNQIFFEYQNIFQGIKIFKDKKIFRYHPQK